MYTFLISSMRAACPNHLVLPDFVTLVIYREEY